MAELETIDGIIHQPNEDFWQYALAPARWNSQMIRAYIMHIDGNKTENLPGNWLMP